ncbi:MAG: adenylate/guanylate cyclase domain-containing protein [Fibrobacterales bacterium]
MKYIHVLYRDIEYDVLLKLLPFMSITGVIGHVFFFVILGYYTPFVEVVELRVLTIVIFSTYYILPKFKFSLWVQWFYELSWVWVMVVFFNIYMVYNQCNVYSASSLIFGAVIYGLGAHPFKALYLFPMATLLVFIGYEDAIVSNPTILLNYMMVNIAAYFLMFLMTGAQAITRRTFLELKSTKHLLAESEKITALTRVFEKFVPKQFLSRISEGGIDRIQFGRAKTEFLTVLFSDIRNFTSISEKYSPQELLDQLNSHFRKISSIIHEHNGFVDKFIGDEVMALFEGNNSDTSYEAVISAIKIQNAQYVYNKWAVQHDLEEFRVGVAIHGGEVVVGTVGSEDRMDSTVLGDVVNVGARLESLTSYYGVDIIVSSNIYNSLVGTYENLIFRELDLVVVKGKSKPELIYEVIGGGGKEALKLKKELLEIYEKALRLYQRGKWIMAIDVFNECLQIYPDDSVSKIYITRSECYLDNPPDSDWERSYDFNSK